MKFFDVLVVGNGIMGYSTAFALATEEPSLKIGIVAPKLRPGSATAAAGAMLGCFSEVTRSTFRSRFGLAKLKMAVESSAMWPSWLAQINESASTEQPLSINSGTFIILNSKSGKQDNENFYSILEALTAYRELYSEVDPNDIPGINPIDDCRPLRALFLPNEGAINILQLLDRFDSFFKQNKNITLIDGLVQKIHVKNEEVESVETDSGESLKAGKILIAAGSYTQKLIDQIPELSTKIPRILSGVGCAFLLKYPESKVNAVVRTPNRAGACGIHLVPRSSNSFFLGASNYVSMEPETAPKVRYVYYLLQYLMEQLNQDYHDAELITSYIGNRPATVDTFPLIGKTSVANLWILTGTYRDGIHDSPLLAQSIAKEMLGISTLFTNDFLPERLPIQTMTKAEAIEEVVEHAMGAGYEHSMKLPNIGWNEMFKEMLYRKFEKLYDSLDTNIGIPPDLLIMLNRNEKKYLSFFRNYYQAIEHKYSNYTFDPRIISEETNTVLA